MFSSGIGFKKFNIYAPVHYKEKQEACQSLANIREEVGKDNCIFASHFNTILSQEEKIGGSRVKYHYREQLYEFILDWNLIDIKPNDGRYTWSNKIIAVDFIVERLDRFLVSSNFLEADMIIQVQNYSLDYLKR